MAAEVASPEQLWIRILDRRMPFGEVIVAIANKHARQIWAMLARDVDHDPHAPVLTISCTSTAAQLERPRGRCRYIVSAKR